MEEVASLLSTGVQEIAGEICKIGLLGDTRYEMGYYQGSLYVAMTEAVWREKNLVAN